MFNAQSVPYLLPMRKIFADLYDRHVTVASIHSASYYIFASLLPAFLKVLIKLFEIVYLFFLIQIYANYAKLVDKFKKAIIKILQYKR